MDRSPTRKVVILIGMPGAGKSAVGRVVARRLGWRFADLDALVEEAEGRSIPEIFAREGESGFREREAAALRIALASEPLVLATGGGAPCSDDNWARMRAAGRVIHLRASPDCLEARTAGGGRPLLRTNRRAQLRALEERRSARYAEADRVVETSDAGVDEVARRVVREVEQWEGDP